MSRFNDLLIEQHGTAIEIPEALERAWRWMEAQGFGSDAASGYVLAPYEGDEQLGPVFAPNLTLEGWFAADAPAARRLLPIAEIAGDGSQAALWVDEEGATRVVALDSDGEGYVLADSAEDFLVLLAIGYEEMKEFDFGEPPEDPDAVDAVEEFREWVGETLDVEVPEEWPEVGEDEFGDWLREQLEAGA
ncbi:hypothetical protein [Gulosibacter sp. 10]|uniref:hypothetical protein n=1 Tax=Gulosibacter sp. 10 TaxID=1255570 RepID=UPI00111E15A4|nr:hypothetical protein [Gulosibacter sp. 10]